MMHFVEFTRFNFKINTNIVYKAVFLYGFLMSDNEINNNINFNQNLHALYI